jgi:hypothetical protein
LIKIKAGIATNTKTSNRGKTCPIKNEQLNTLISDRYNRSII